MKRKFTAFILIVTICFFTGKIYAQNIQYSMFDAMPLVVNPAYTGMIDGKVRGNTIYRNQWKSVTVPYVSFGVSLDAPVLTLKNGDYFGAGLLVMHDKAGDGNLQNFLGAASVSYHKLIGKDSAFYKGRGCDLAFGVQAGYANSMMDMSELYFGRGISYNTFLPPPGWYHLGIGNHINYYMLNAGISFSQSLTKQFNYTIGFKANNINQPNDALLKKQNADFGIDMRYIISAGCNIVLANKFTLRPAAVMVNRATGNDFIAGSEFQYEVKAVRTPPRIFIGTWYHTGDFVTVTAGVNIGVIRIGVGYDYNISTLNSANGGNGGFELAVGFTHPGKTGRQRYVPCTRF